MSWDAGLGNMVYSRSDIVSAVEKAYGRVKEKVANDQMNFIGGVSEDISRFTLLLPQAWDADLGNMVYSEKVVFDAVKISGGVVLVGGKKVF